MSGTARQRILRAMRRALVLTTVLAATLLGTGLTVAGEPARAPGFYDEAEDVIFSLKADGFTAEVIGEDNDGEQTASLIIARHGYTRGGLLAEDIAPAPLPDHSLTAKFGALGELNFEFKPRKCKGGLAFSGAFHFTGENGYVQIDADRATGSFASNAYSACGPLGPVDFSTIRQITSRVQVEATAPASP